MQKLLARIRVFPSVAKIWNLPRILKGVYRSRPKMRGRRPFFVDVAHWGMLNARNGESNHYPESHNADEADIMF